MWNEVVFTQTENRTGVFSKSRPGALCQEHQGLENKKAGSLIQQHKAESLGHIHLQRLCS